MKALDEAEAERKRKLKVKEEKNAIYEHFIEGDLDYNGVTDKEIED